MTRRAAIEILGDATSFAKAARESAVVAERLAGDMDKLAVTAKASANAQIQASVRKDARLREEIVAYRAVAASAAKGSKEQIAAANLADQAQARLARSMAVTTHESRALASSSSSAERSISRATRGALAGSGIFTRFGRSLAFASGGFLAFASAGQFLRTSVDAARDAEVTQKQLAQQLANSGKSFDQYGARIEKANLKLSALSGFTRDDLDKSFTTIFRTTGNVSKALRDTATAADLARARHIGLAQSAFVIAKVEAGNTTLLRRQSFQVAKNATAEQALAKVRGVIAGQAAAGTTEQERFGAVLHDTEEIVGRGILPTLNKYLVSGSEWLQQMDESGKLQRNVATAANGLSGAIKAATQVIRIADKVTGSFAHTLELLVGIKVASGVAGIASNLGLLGKSAEQATGKVAVLRTRLVSLVANPYTATIVVVAVGAEIAAAKIKALQKQALDAQASPLIKGSGLETTLVPALSKEIGGLRQAGQSSKQILATLRKQLGGSLKADDLIAEAFSFGSGSDKKLRQRIREALNKASAVATDEVGKHPINITAAQRNTFFDNAISRILSRGSLGDIQQQISSIGQASALITKRISVTKDVTRKLNLEDQLLQLRSQAVGLRKQSAQDFLASLQLGLTKAQATPRLDDDLDALKNIQNALKAQIKEFGNTTELASQLFDTVQQSKQIFAQARSSAASALGELGQGPVVTGQAAQFLQQFGGKLTAKIFTQDLVAQNKAFQAELRNIATLKKRGAPDELVQQLFGQGQAGQTQIAALAKASPGQAQAFFRAFAQSQRLETRAARMIVTASTMTVTAKTVTLKSDASDRRPQPAASPAASKFTRTGASARRR